MNNKLNIWNFVSTFLILVVGFIFGWQGHSISVFSNALVNSEIALENAVQSSQNLTGRASVRPVSESETSATAFSTTAIEGETKSTSNATTHKLATDEFVSMLADMSQEKFHQIINSGGFNSIFSESSELFFELISGLLNFEDNVLRDRITTVLLFQNHRDTDYSAEQFMMTKIQAYDRAPEWLGVLRQFGLQDKQNILYLNQELGNYSNAQQVSNALSTIANSGFSSDLNNPELETIVKTIEPYLAANEDNIRAAAVSAVAHYPFEDKETILQRALTDNSHKVRVEAMHVVANQHIKPAEIQDLVIEIMNNTSATPLERLTAHDISKIFALTETQYKAAYEFGMNEAEELQHQYSEEQRSVHRKSLL